MRLLLALAFLAFGVAQAEPRAKITHGFTDGDDHPYVAAFSTRGSVGKYYAHCSAALLDATHVLTAAHCSWTGTDESDDRVTVTVSPVIDPQGEWKQLVHGTLYMHPQYDKDSASHDIAVIVLDRPIWSTDRLSLRTMGFNVQYAQLPRLGQLDTEHATFTAVGYGTTDGSEDPNVTATVRRWTTERYHSRGDNTFKTEAMPGLPCKDDSGSPALFGSSNVIAGVMSMDGCAGNPIYARVDAPDNRAFLARFVELP